MSMSFVMIEWKIELLTLLFLGFSSMTDAAITLTVNPSYDVKVNQMVTLTCELDPNQSPPIHVSFESDKNSLCYLEPSYGNCKNTSNSCITRYTASCHNETTYILQLTVPWNWNGMRVHCQTLYDRSNYVVFAVKVPVTYVTLTPTSITVIAGQKIDINCTTSYCIPQANITWYISSIDISRQSKFTTDTNDGLVRTMSALSINLDKSDNGKQVYCTAINIPDQSVTSMMNTVTVLYRPVVASNVSSSYKVLEGTTAVLRCAVIAANPNTGIMWRWFRTETPIDFEFLSYIPIFTISHIHRNMSGSYNCSASNSVGTSEAAVITVDVQYKPNIIDTQRTEVNEGERVVLTKEIVSNPLSNVSWYNGSELLLTESSVRTATYTIEKAVCMDTKNFTLLASNTVKKNVSGLVELVVNYHLVYFICL
eukprot:XP_011457195.1 PREDICTED: B-cell receptor CD22 [Crassostrea gigas]